MRASTSVLPPGGKGTIIVTGLVGHSAAAAGRASTHAINSSESCRFMPISFEAFMIGTFPLIGQSRTTVSKNSVRWVPRGLAASWALQAMKVGLPCR